MKILFVSRDLIGGSLAQRLIIDGHDVRLFIKDKGKKRDFDGIVPKTSDWKRSLAWVGRDGLIVFDDVGFGKYQDTLRKFGYTVFGGSYEGEKLEVDRAFCNDFFRNMGLSVRDVKDFSTPKSLYNYLLDKQGPWVLKQNNHTKKDLNFVGELPSGRDVLSVLEQYMKSDYANKEKITLQKRVYGVEVGIGRYFNGTDWTGPVEINFEHTRFFPGGIGPLTSEMGTLAWYTENEGVLFQRVLKPFEEYLKASDFRGDFAVNCIINENKIYPLETTCRLGSPIIHLHQEFHKTKWSDFLTRIGRSEPCKLSWKEGMGIVVLVTIPTFPQRRVITSIFEETEVFFDNLTESDLEHVHFEGIYKRKNGRYYVSDDHGYVLCVTGLGKTVTEARNKAYAIIKKIVIPKMMYRTDIGVKFVLQDYEKLKKWGYLSKEDLPFYDHSEEADLGGHFFV